MPRGLSTMKKFGLNESHSMRRRLVISASTGTPAKSNDSVSPMPMPSSRAMSSSTDTWVGPS